jgi:hypothetical protein
MGSLGALLFAGKLKRLGVLFYGKPFRLVDRISRVSEGLKFSQTDLAF